MSADGERRLRRTRIALLIVLTALSAAKSALWATTQPIFTPLDEAQHYDYVARLASGSGPPVVGRDLLPPERLSILRTSLWAGERAGLSGDPLGRGRVPLDPDELDRVLPPAAGVAGLRYSHSYQGWQPPLGYALLAPGYLLAGDEGAGRVLAVRLWGSTLAALVVVVTYHLALALFPGAAAAALLAAGITGAVQSVNAFGGAVSNDALLPLAGAVASLACVAAFRRKDAGAAWLLAGLTVGCGILVKTTLLLFLPVLALAAVAAGLSRALVRRLLLAGAGVVVALGPWAAWNLAVYGSMRGAYSAMVAVTGLPSRPFAVEVLTDAVGAFVRGMWSAPFTRGGTTPVHDGLALAVCLGGVIGGLVAVARRRRTGPAVIACFATIPISVAVLVGMNYVFTEGRMDLLARYALPILPALVTASVLGVRELVNPRARVAVASVVVPLLVAADVHLMAGIMHIVYLEPA